MNVNSRGANSETALHAAVYSRYGNEKELIEYLLKQGANIHLKDHGGKTPYDRALSLGKNELLPLLKIKPEISQEAAWQKSREKSQPTWSIFKLFFAKKTTQPAKKEDKNRIISFKNKLF